LLLLVSVWYFASFFWVIFRSDEFQRRSRGIFLAGKTKGLARAIFQKTQAGTTALGVCFQGVYMSTDAVLPLYAVVEDEPFMAEMVCDMLASRGLNVEVFHHGADFLRSANLRNFQAIVLDLSLPDIDGFVLMDKLVDQAVYASMVLMSGHDLAIVRAAKIYGNGIGLHVRAALTKPFTKEELFAALGL
jgi:CheY-like chemotaxis protein